MKKIFSALIMLTLIFSSFALAQEDNQSTTGDATQADAQVGLSPEQTAYNWLVDQAVDGNYGNDIASTALAGLALSQVGYVSSARTSANWILTQKDDKNCFPAGDCIVKDTALALALLNDLGYAEADGVSAWLQEAQNPATSLGKWLVEISTQSSGTCDVSYMLGNNSFSDSVEVDKGMFPACGNSNFLDLDSCYKSGLIRAQPGLTFTVDCSSLEGDTPIITLVYNSDSTFYIVNTVFGNIADLTVANGCYSRSESGQCSKASSLYASWALSLAGNPTNINLYLIENYDPASIEDNALLYTSLQTKNNKYLEALATRQNSDGSFSRDFYQTGLAMLALQDSAQYSERISKAKDWLLSKQSADGSWNQNVRDTAMVLYAGFADAILQPEQVKATQPGEEAGTCNYDYSCDPDLGETADSCTDCILLETGGACNNDGVCDYLDGESTDNCIDCFCGDNICDNSETSNSCSDDCQAETTPTQESFCGDNVCDFDETADSCPNDCQSAGGGIGFGTILIIILIIALVGIGAYFGYKKFKKPSQPAAKQSPFGPRQGAAPLKRTASAKPQTKKPSGSESQLQKSLEEARKLLKK